MSAGAEIVLLALLLFQIKHFLADFVFQTLEQVRAKGRYGAWGGVSHAALHALLSIPVLLLALTRDPMTVAIVAAAEFALHYHIDFAKARIDRHFGWSFLDQQYWIVFGTDQFLHQMTYWAMVYVLVR